MRLQKHIITIFTWNLFGKSMPYIDKTQIHTTTIHVCLKIFKSRFTYYNTCTFLKHLKNSAVKLIFEISKAMVRGCGNAMQCLTLLYRMHHMVYIL